MNEISLKKRFKSLKEAYAFSLLNEGVATTVAVLVGSVVLVFLAYLFGEKEIFYLSSFFSMLILVSIPSFRLYFVAKSWKSKFVFEEKHFLISYEDAEDLFFCYSKLTRVNVSIRNGVIILFAVPDNSSQCESFIVRGLTREEVGYLTNFLKSKNSNCLFYGLN